MDDVVGPPFSSWLADHPTVTLATFADAGVHADVVVNASSGNVSVDVVGLADGGGNLAGKVLIDVANALDFSQGFPPSLFVKDTDSLAEMIQRAVPEARVVKTLSSVAHELMVDPKALADGDHTIFVSGDDADAKAVATELLQELGWTDILDLGELRTARGVEMMMPLWISLSGIVGRDQINFKVVRPD